MPTLNEIELKDTETGAINYVKARYAIDDPNSGLSNRKARRDARNAVVEFLKGKIEHDVKRGTIVVFPDNTVAKY
jgi:hypothetical protein